MKNNNKEFSDEITQVHDCRAMALKLATRTDKIEDRFNKAIDNMVSTLRMSFADLDAREDARFEVLVNLIMSDASRIVSDIDDGEIQ